MRTGEDGGKAETGRQRRRKWRIGGGRSLLKVDSRGAELWNEVEDKEEGQIEIIEILRFLLCYETFGGGE